ncbi:MAG: hypothetical protein U1E51_30185 [Candidatus Binatia bacterium]|nr:hypothetical protein [Candidatus Binatia bacterium]
MKWLSIIWQFVLRLWAVMTARAVAREQDRSEKQAGLRQEAGDHIAKAEEIEKQREKLLREKGLWKD